MIQSWFTTLLLFLTAKATYAVELKDLNAELSYHGLTLVYFYTKEYCQQCSLNNEVFKLLADDLATINSDVHIVAIEAEANQELVNQQRVNQFPTIRMYWNSHRFLEYPSAYIRDKDIRSWVERHSELTLPRTPQTWHEKMHRFKTLVTADIRGNLARKGFSLLLGVYMFTYIAGAGLSVFVLSIAMMLEDEKLLTPFDFSFVEDMSAAYEQLASLLSRVTELEKKEADNSATIRQLEKKNSDLNTSLQDEKNTNFELKTYVGDLTKEIEGLRIEAETGERVANELIEENEMRMGFELEVMSLKNVLRELEHCTEKRASEDKHRFHELMDGFNKQTVMIEELETERFELVGRMAELEKLGRDAKKERKGFQSVVSEDRKAKETMERNYAVLKKSFEEVQQELTKAHSNIRVLESDLKKSKAAVKALERDLEDEWTKSEELEEQIDEMTIKIVQLKEQRGQMDVLEGELYSLREQLTVYEARVRDMEQTIQEQEAFAVSQVIRILDLEDNLNDIHGKEVESPQSEPVAKVPEEVNNGNAQDQNMATQSEDRVVN